MLAAALGPRASASQETTTAPPAAVQPPPPPLPRATEALSIKYMRDSEEYAAIARQTYRLAGEAVTRSNPSGAWVVVLDVDETTLDNSTYQVERAVYGLPFEITSWNAWIERRQAPAVPGVVDFVGLVHRAGGRVAWITDRSAAVTEATRTNLRQAGLWTDDDRLCAQKNAQHTKAQRRAEVLSGAGECSWSGQSMRVVAFVGDQVTDFPAAAEKIPDTGTDEAFGRTCFLLPNSMYGGWETRVTRVPR
jgi:5'-nucleotidase (lipoprotein e(P4) family)